MGRLYDLQEWRRLRRAACERDGWRCTVEGCGAVGALEVHHKLSVRERPDLALELDNLVTVCRSCHFRLTRGELEALPGSRAARLRTMTAWADLAAEAR